MERKSPLPGWEMVYHGRVTKCLRRPEFRKWKKLFMGRRGGLPGIWNLVSRIGGDKGLMACGEQSRVTLGANQI